MIKFGLTAIISLGCSAAMAEVRTETSCYSRAWTAKSPKPVELVLRTYIDHDLKKEIGAFVQYNGSKETIPLVLTKYVDTDTDSPELGNYEITRVEIIGNKVGGKYLFVRMGAGIRQGRFMKYRNPKTGKVDLFHYSSTGPSCNSTVPE